MIDYNKHIDYWKMTASSDIDTAQLLIEKGKIKEGLFFCHLFIEKILKAHYVKVNSSIAPRTHDLIYLINKSNIVFNDEYLKYIIFLQKFQLEGRYPDYNIEIPKKEEGLNYLTQGKEIYNWLVNLL